MINNSDLSESQRTIISVSQGRYSLGEDLSLKTGARQQQGTRPPVTGRLLGFNSGGIISKPRDSLKPVKIVLANVGVVGL